MSNDLIELTDAELDAVTGGNGGLLALNFGNIVTQVNTAELSAAIVNTGSFSNSPSTITQSVGSQSNNSSITGGNPSFGTFSFV